MLYILIIVILSVNLLFTFRGLETQEKQNRRQNISPRRWLRKCLTKFPNFMDEETETESSLVTEEGYNVIVLFFQGSILPKKTKRRNTSSQPSPL